MTRAALGPITFDLLNSFSEFSKKNSYKYAEHSVIDGKPKLQYMGANLTTLNLTFHFHKGFCDPSVEHLKLIGAAEAHTPLPLIFGGGAYHGLYVIEDLSTDLKQTDEDGNVIDMQVKVTLKEWDEFNLL